MRFNLNKKSDSIELSGLGSRTCSLWF